MPCARIAFATFLWIVVGTSNAAAQDSAKKAETCLTARPAAYCRKIALTNAGIYGAIGNLGDRYGPNFRQARITVDWGLLFPIGRRAAAGASFLYSQDIDRHFIAPMVRFRQWFRGDKSSLEIGVGATLPSYHDPFGGSGPSATLGLVKWNPSPTVGIVVRPEWRTRTDSTRCNPAPTYGCTEYRQGHAVVSVGIELSGKPGLIGTLPALLVAAMLQLGNSP